MSVSRDAEDFPIHPAFLVGAPRTARNPNEKSEPYGNEAHKFASRFMQRDVEVGQSSFLRWTSSLSFSPDLLLPLIWTTQISSLLTRPVGSSEPCTLTRRPTWPSSSSGPDSPPSTASRRSRSRTDERYRLPRTRLRGRSETYVRKTKPSLVGLLADGPPFLPVIALALVRPCRRGGRAKDGRCRSRSRRRSPYCLFVQTSAPASPRLDSSPC